MMTTLGAEAFPVPVSLHMLIASMSTIWLGSFGALKSSVRKDAGKPAVAAEEVHHLTRREVYMSPVLGSVLLFGLYIVYKLCPKYYVNLLVRAYFVVFGVLSVGDQVAYMVKSLCKPKPWHSEPLLQFKIPCYELLDKTFGLTPEGFEGGDPADMAMSPLELVGYLFGTMVGVWYIGVNHWIANNIFGVAFSLQAIRALSIGSFFNGAILLSGLFIYDIFWVFGTDVMVTVAKSFDAPIKLLFPRWTQDSESGKWQSSILGLGDIVMPGIFVALMLRFDHYTRVKLGKRGGAPKDSEGFLNRYPYFTTTMVGYALGLATTIAIMTIFNAAQPALLYLVPSCIGAAVLCALRLGEFSELWKYEEGEEADEKAAKKTE
eukprot:CAMPEP_0197526900 /NCGR_PEP_ID=MMETSP1318-20131121/19671_1 /TAXON_ID=552666 /ORGANISM="Partenskyella glossopodia, Strain RCC365" /LENGTH=375 /DNA_ID=CAMNT_0043081287 /DNA_START=1 /DNA_END=1128 /DNA_ORIENTATION=+